MIINYTTHNPLMVKPELRIFHNCKSLKIKRMSKIHVVMDVYVK